MQNNVKKMKNELKEILNQLEAELTEYANFEIDAKLYKLQQEVMKASAFVDNLNFADAFFIEENDVVEEIVNKMLSALDTNYEISSKEMQEHLRSLFIVMNDLLVTMQNALNDLKLGVVKPRDFSEMLKAFASIQSEFRKTIETFGGEEYVAKRNAIADAMREMLVVKGKALIKTELYKRKLEYANTVIQQQKQLIRALINLTAFLLSKYKRLYDVEQRLLKARSEQARLMATLIKKDIGMITEDEIKIVEIPAEFTKILENIAQERQAIEKVEKTLEEINKTLDGGGGEGGI